MAPVSSPSTTTVICRRPTSPTGDPAGTEAFSVDLVRRTAQSLSPTPVSPTPVSPAAMGVRDGLGSTGHTELAVERGQTVVQSSGHDPELLGDLRNGLRRVDREQQRLLGRGRDEQIGRASCRETGEMAVEGGS